MITSAENVTYKIVSLRIVNVSYVLSSILNLPGESTLRRDFLRLQLANKERSEALRRQQLEQQQRENEEHKRQLLAERQKRIEEQKEQRRRLEEVMLFAFLCTMDVQLYRGQKYLQNV